MDGEDADYCGTGGMICDASIFKKEDFWKSWNKEFYFVEDLYLSLYAKNMGWNLKAKDFPIKFNKNCRDKNAMFFRHGIRKLKEKLSIIGIKKQ